MKKKIALVVSHPIQHFCPQYVSFAQNEHIHFKVFFGSALGLKKYVDPSFKQEISWGNLELEKFDHVFLNGEAVLTSDKNLDAASLETSLEDFAPDIVIIYGYFQKLQRRAYKWARKNKRKIAYISDSERRQKLNPLKELIKYPFVYTFFRGVDFFLTVGDANEQYYAYYKVPQHKFIRMHFPIDIQLYKTSFTGRELLRKQIRSRYNIADQEIVVSTVGKMQFFKSQDHIVEALQAFEKSNGSTKIHFLIAGSGEAEELVRQKSKSLSFCEVHLLGFVSPNDLPAVYAATDVYIHPSMKDRHPLSVSEAIYMGCPIILSDRCGSYGPSDDVRDNENGYVYQYGNIEQLALLINQLATGSKLRQQFSNRSHAIGVKQQETSHHSVLNHLVESL